MAAPTVQVLESNDKNHIIHCVGVADATGGLIVDISTLAADSRDRAVTDLVLQSVKCDTDGLIVVAWDATADVPILQISTSRDHCYEKIGGIPNNAGAGKTGDVLIPAPAAARNYDMTLKFRKKYD